MKQLLPLLLLFSIVAQAQKEIKLEELLGHIGDSVTVKGLISGVRYLEAAKNTPTFINVGGTYPAQKLTIVIWREVRKKFTYKPEEKPYSTGMAIVSGKVELYKGKPQIVVTDPEQLKIAYDEEVPLSQLPPIEKKQ